MLLLQMMESFEVESAFDGTESKAVLFIGSFFRKG